MSQYKPFRFTVRGVLKDSAGRILMMRRTPDSKTNPGCWEFPGGKVDRGEHFAESLVREFQEEASVEVVPVKVLSGFEWEMPEYKTAYFILEVALIKGNVKISDEHDAFQWMVKNDFKKEKISPPLFDFVTTVILPSL